MKFNNLFFYSFMFVSLSSLGQQTKNSVKVNVAGLAMNIYSVQYERMLGKNISFNNTFFYRPKSKIPFANAIDDFAKKHGVGVTGIKFDDIYMNEAQLGMLGYSPELRFYLGKSRHKPFIGLFGIYESFKLRVPAQIEVMKYGEFLPVKLPISFSFETLAGGILIGKQFKWDRIGLDIVVVGPHFGAARDFYAKGSAQAIQNLNEAEKQYVIDDVKNRFGMTDKYFRLDITDTDAEIRSVRNVPYFGIRGVGFNLSYNF